MEEDLVPVWKTYKTQVKTNYIDFLSNASLQSPSFLLPLSSSMLSPPLSSQMGNQNLFHFQKPFSIFNLFIFFPALFSKTLSDDSKFKACSPRNCGNGPNISYPFYIPQEQESYCGYPSFEITCHEKNPVLSISNEDYLIKDILYSNQSFLLADYSLYDNTCPTPLNNFTLDHTPFNYSSDHADLYFFYRCTSRPDYFGIYPIECASNSTHHSFAGFHKELLGHFNFTVESCQSSNNAPVYVNGDDGKEVLLKSNYTEILEEGFVLSWNEANCSSCENSGGHCGYDNSEFVCFCRDRPHLKTCNDGNSAMPHSFWNRRHVCFSCLSSLNYALEFV